VYFGIDRDMEKYGYEFRAVDTNVMIMNGYEIGKEEKERGKKIKRFKLTTRVASIY